MQTDRIDVVYWHICLEIIAQYSSLCNVVISVALVMSLLSPVFVQSVSVTTDNSSGVKEHQIFRRQLYLVFNKEQLVVWWLRLWSLIPLFVSHRLHLKGCVAISVWMHHSRTATHRWA